jgi:hypothetical protein
LQPSGEKTYADFVQILVLPGIGIVF